MSTHHHEESLANTANEETYDATYDPADDAEEEENVSYLVPRLAAYAAPSRSSSASSLASATESGDATTYPDSRRNPTHVNEELNEEEGEEEEEEQARGEAIRVARDSGERSAAHITDDSVVDNDEPHEVTAEAVMYDDEERADTLDHVGVLSTQDHAEVEFTQRTQRGEKEEGEVWEEEGWNDGVYGAVNEENDDDDDDEAAEDNGVDVDSDSDHRRGQHGASASASSSSTFASAFAHSRVKELLKYEGSSSIISKDAATAACEAVALLTRDLVAMAAAEASRKHRKTVTYDDVARVAQMLDRFSYLAEVVPPVPAASSSSLGAGRSIVVGSHLPTPKPNQSKTSSAGNGGGGRKKAEVSLRSRSEQGRGRAQTTEAHGAAAAAAAAARSRTTHPRVGATGPTLSGAHPQPGGLRQATLRF